ncbi:sialate O-acetylesterase [Spirosoma fluminis]
MTLFALRLWLLLSCLLPGISFAQLSVTSPVPRMVFQRNSYNEANVLVAGLAPSTATQIEARFVPLATGQGQLTPWTPLDFLPTSKAFRGTVPVTAGWYRLDVRAKSGAAVLTQMQVNRVGVGEVFVIAGQSNAVGGFEREPGASDDRVSCLDFRQDALDEQLLPLRFSHVSYGTSIGPSQPPHIWGQLGDKLVRRLNVPVLFLGAAQAGTSSEQWRQSAAGGTDAQGRPNPYRRLGVVLQHYVARTGARAILWHQGEGDIGSAGDTYFSNISYVIRKTRQQTGFDNLPWVVSRVTYVQGQTNAGVIAAQNRLITDVNDVFAGPSTDDLTGPDNRLGDNVHIGGKGLARFTDRWDESLTNNFFANSTPLTPNTESALITSSYTLPLVRRPGETVLSPSLRTDPHEADNQYFVQLLRAADNTLVAESARSTDNPISLTLPANLPDGQYRLRTLSTHPAAAGTLGEPFRVDYAASPTPTAQPIPPVVTGGTASSALQRIGYRYEAESHGFFAMIQASAPMEVRLQRLDGGSSDSGWNPAPASGQAPDFADFADFNYIRSYPPISGGIGGVEPGRYRLSVRPQGTTGDGIWYEVQLLDGRNILYASMEPVSALPTVLTLTSLNPVSPCRGTTFSVAFEATESPVNAGNLYTVRLSDRDGSFVNETTIGSGSGSPIPATLPASLPPGNYYRLRLVASNPGVASAPGESLTFCAGVPSTPPPADISLAMYASSRLLQPGQPVTVTLVLTNSSSSPVSAITVKSVLPAGLAFVEALHPAISATGTEVTVNAGSLAPSASVPFAFRLKANRAGSFVAAAQVTASSQPDPDSQPNSGTGDGQDDTAQLDLRTTDAEGGQSISPNANQAPLPPVQSNQPSPTANQSDLSLEIVASSLTTLSNNTLSVQLRVKNQGSLAADNVVIRTVLPVGWSLTNSNGLTIDGQTVSGLIGRITAGSASVVTLSIRAAADGRLQAQVFANSVSDADSTPGNGYDNGEDDEASIGIRTRL